MTLVGTPVRGHRLPDPTALGRRCRLGSTNPEAMP